MNALVLSAGAGERMKPLTLMTPKPLLPVLHEPMIKQIIDRLFAHGIERVGVNCYHEAGQITQYLEQLGDRVHVNTENRLRGTGGALTDFRSFFPDDFIIHSGDVISDVDFTALIAFHRTQRAFATLVLVEQTGTRIIQVDDGLHVRDVTDDDKNNGFSYAGIGVFSGSVFSILPERDIFSIIDIFRAIIKNKEIMIGFRHRSAWYNVNSPYEYWRVHRDILTSKTHIDGITPSGAFFFHPTSSVRTKTLSGFVVVGAHARISEHVVLENTIVFRDTNVSRGTYKNVLLSDHFCLNMN
ncbi:MAG: NDP-sugar synthase [candidate division WOR-3 bacterium]|nr:MAG: NDP-sugar synthase [candidate division WOR-3 bacterium]